MGQKDIAEKYLENYNDVFADIVNGLLFEGKELVLPEDLQTAREQTQYKTEEGVLHEQERDVSKYWVKGGARISIYGLENQTKIDRDMPFRAIGYDGASYREQLLKDEEGNQKKERFPVISLILYFGEKRWSGPKTIREMMDIPTELEPYVNDYKIHVFEISWLTEEQLELFQSDFKIVADYFIQKRKKKDYIPSTQRIRHVDAVLKMLEACSGDHRFAESMVETDQRGKEAKNMCEVLDKIVARGEARGIGQMVGVIRKKLQKHMDIPAITDILELEENYVAELAGLIESNPELTDVEVAEKYLAEHSDSCHM